MFYGEFMIIKNYKDIQAIVLAAGKSSRFKSPKTKLSHKLCGKEIVTFPLQILSNLKIPTIMVVGYKKEELKTIVDNHKFDNISYCEQTKQLGTGHAVQCTQTLLTGNDILIINADMPLITQDIIEDIINKHKKSNATISFIISYNNNTNNSYGRVIKTNNKVEIIEAKDLKEQNKDLANYKYINAGIYIIKKDFLKKAIDSLEKSVTTSELYITDLVKKASDIGLTVNTIEVNLNFIRGINTQQELLEASQIKKHAIINDLMSNGVTFTDPESVTIDFDTQIKPGTTIESNVKLTNGTYIGSECTIESGSNISNSHIEDFITIKQNSIVHDSTIKNSAQIGPFAHIRKNSIISEYANIGNFVEISNSTIGKYTKAKHLAYIGSSQIGSKVNIGAGTVTCNYNGFTKNITIIKDNAFIGSNCSLVAPITIGENAIVGAGSVITKNVPDNALAIERNDQVIKNDYAKILLNKYKSLKQAIL